MKGPFLGKRKPREKKRQFYKRPMYGPDDAPEHTWQRLQVWRERLVHECLRNQTFYPWNNSK